ncbi:MAG: hypothetical protein WC369_01145 [Dehalococcoidales bacterium]
MTEDHRKEAKVKFGKSDISQKDSSANNNAGTDSKQNKPQEARPMPLTLEVEPNIQDDLIEPIGETSPSNVEPIDGHTGSGEVSFVPITPESEAEAENIDGMFTKPVNPIPETIIEKKAITLDLSNALSSEEETESSDKNNDFMSLFDKNEEEEDSSIRELIASMPEVNMPEILHEAGTVKELIADLAQRDWVKAAHKDVEDAYTLRFISKGGKDDGKKTKQASR